MTADVGSRANPVAGRPVAPERASVGSYTRSARGVHLKSPKK